MSCHRYLFLPRIKDDNSILLIDVKKDKGEISFRLINKTNNSVILLENPESGMYQYSLLKNNKYRIEITAKHTSGHYIIKKIHKD